MNNKSRRLQVATQGTMMLDGHHLTLKGARYLYHQQHTAMIATEQWRIVQ